MSTIFKNDLIFYKDDNGAIMSGGYNVESHMLQQGISPMQTLNMDQTAGGKSNKVSNSFENLAVPAGLYFITQKNNKKKEQTNYNKDHEALSDDIFDKLYDMIKYDDKKKRKTRKQDLKIVTTSGKHKKTKKQKTKI